MDPGLNIAPARSSSVFGLRRHSALASHTSRERNRLRSVEPRESRRVELLIPIRTLLIVFGAIAVMGAFVAIGSTFLIVFIGIFLGLVFEFPVRFVMRKTNMSRGLAATITVLGTAIGVVVIALLFLVPMVGSVRDFLHELPQTLEQLRNSDELSWLGNTGIGGNAQEGAQKRPLGARRDLGRPRDRGRLLAVFSPASRSSSSASSS